MVSNFLMVILAITALIGALLVFKIAVNMGKKMAHVNSLLEMKNQTGKGGNKKRSSGAARNFAPSQFS